jgi:predicted transcriptional regulator
MKEDPVTISPQLSVQELVEKYIFKHHFKMFPVVDEGKLVGCATLAQVKSIPHEEWPRRSVAELSSGCTQDNTVSADEDVMKALALMNRTNASRLMVVEGEKLVGVITLKDIMKLLSLKVDLET